MTPASRRLVSQPASPWPFVSLSVIVMGGLLAWASITRSGYSEVSTLPASVPYDSGPDQTMAAAWSTIAAPTNTKAPTETRVPTSTVYATATLTPYPYCVTVRDGNCLLFETGQVIPTATLRPCSITTPSAVAEIPCEKYDTGMDNREDVK